jgi:prolyl oligopeptidase
LHSKPNSLMKKNIFLFSCFFSLSIAAQEYPITKKTTSTITKHLLSFQDDYTWLEKMGSNEVNEWVDKQNETAKIHFDEIEKKSSSAASKIREYDTKTTYRIPSKRGKYFYTSLSKDKKTSSSLFMMKNLNDYPIEIVNPNEIYPESNVTLAGSYPSKNSERLAYKISVDGSDKQEIRFIDLNKNKKIDDVLKNVKFSTVAWNNDRGVIYKQNENKDFFAKDSTYKLYYHYIGTKQEDDKLIFDTSKSEGDFTFFTSKSKLFITETNKEETLKNYYYADLEGDAFHLNKFIANDKSNFKLINYYKGRIYYSSNDYNWGEIRSFNLQNKEDEKSVVPQIYNHLLEYTYFSEEYLICKYKTFGKDYIIIYNYDGKFVRKIESPYGMNITALNYDSESKDFYYGLHSYTNPFENYKINLDSGYEQPLFSITNKSKPTLFPTTYFETKITSYKNRDNADVTLTLVYKKGMKLDGNNPTLLKAYGGFGTVSSPNYDTGLIYFLEKGGVFAYAEIRGGGEKGEKWHKEGVNLKKINTFNDFIDAAEFLIKEKYTSSNKLAISGGSQGGLLVGVAMIKRPDLFKLAIPQVGVFDMAKFNDYTTGRFHNDEYGNPEKEEEYKAMMEYSPYHNIKEDINYPITLIMTSENDDRVPPVHSYKFAARLQNRIAQKNPIYIKTAKKSGHYGNTSTYEKRLEEKATFYNFLIHHLNQ